MPPAIFPPALRETIIERESAVCLPDEAEFLNFAKQIILADRPASGQNIDKIHNKFRTYQQIVSKYSSRFVLISHNDLEIIWVRHFIDSVINIKLFPKLFKDSQSSQGENLRSIDVGSGAGLPGLAQSIFLSGLDTVLLESNNRKCFFLKKLALEELGLKNVDIICARAENLAHNSGYREKFDFATARALAKPAAAVELVLPFIKVGAHAFFWGSGEDWNNPENYSKVCTMLGCRIVESKSYHLSSDERERRIVMMEKIAPTNSQYPRRDGVPQKRPLSSRT